MGESTYGAQPGSAQGDLGVLYDMEQALGAGPAPFSALRAAYCMSNWDASLKTAREEGKVYSMYPPDFKLPMVAPHDLGEFAAKLMLGSPAPSGPPAQWEQAFKLLGFLDAAAKSYVAMTRITLEEKYELPGKPQRGVVSLNEYITALVNKSCA